MNKRVALAVGLVGILVSCMTLQVRADFYNLIQQPSEEQPKVKILTLNVMQWATESRAARFQRIVSYLTANPVHFLTLQELSGGPYDEPPTTVDSGADLANMLATAGLQYGYYTEANWGYPPYLVFKVGILPRYHMLTTAAGVTGTPGDGWVFPERRNVVMAGMEIPGFGRINLYSVHVYTPSAEGLETQIDNLLQFVNQTDTENPAVASVVAGDMNFSVDANSTAYQKFLAQGFIDSYAAAQGLSDPGTCCTSDDTGGCTFGLPDNPFVTGGSPARIDFVFIRGKSIRVKASNVVFNAVGSFVSDHCGVLTEIIRSGNIPSALLLIED